MNDYYVYEWFIIKTDHVFHVGKGKNDRYKNVTDRNIYFKRIYNKYNTDVRIYRSGLTEEEAWELEIQRIKELKAIGQCETNIHRGEKGGDTVSDMPDELYNDFCSKIGQNTKEHWENDEFRNKIINSLLVTFQDPEMRQKISQCTKEAMNRPDVYESMWEKGLSSPVLLVFQDKSYKIFKLISNYKQYLKSNFNVGGRVCYNLFTMNFRITPQTKNNPNIENLVGAHSYYLNKQLFKSVTTMADECKPVEEILSLLEAQNNQ